MRINSVAMKLGFIPSVMSLQHFAKRRFNGGSLEKLYNGVKERTKKARGSCDLGGRRPLALRQLRNILGGILFLCLKAKIRLFIVFVNIFIKIILKNQI